MSGVWERREWEGGSRCSSLTEMRKRVGNRIRRRRRGWKARSFLKVENDGTSEGQDGWRRTEVGGWWEVEGGRREERNKDGRSRLRVCPPPSHTLDGNKRKKGRKLRSELKVGIRRFASRCEGVSRGNSSYWFRGATLEEKHAWWTQLLDLSLFLILSFSLSIFLPLHPLSLPLNEQRLRSTLWSSNIFFPQTL